MAHAAQFSKNEGSYLSRFIFSYGDASKSPIITDSILGQIKDSYSDIFDFNYHFFGFNSGTSKGHNILNEKCTADFTLLMNPDIVVTADFFIEIIRPFQDTQLEVGITEGKQIPIEHPKAFDFETRETSWASGACSVIRTRLFRELGGYDENSFFLYCDDVDLSWRVRMAGYKIIYCPTAPIYHAKRMNMNGLLSSDAERYYSAEAALLMAHKWSNPHRVHDLLKYFRASSDENLKKIAVEYEHRRVGELLPQPLDPDHKIERFIGGHYALHRFEL